jgi:hypothetical protein
MPFADPLLTQTGWHPHELIETYELLLRKLSREVPWPRDESFQKLGISQGRSMAETNDSRLQAGKNIHRAPVLLRVGAGNGRRQPEARPPGHEMDVGQHVARNADAVGLAEKNYVAGSMTRCVHHAEAGNFITLIEDLINWVRRTSPQPLGKANHPVVRLHGGNTHHRRHIGPVACQRRSKRLANGLGGPLMVRVAMRQRDQPDRMGAQMFQETALAPTRACID